jgi:hypothetical protein
VQGRGGGRGISRKRMVRGEGLLLLLVLVDYDGEFLFQFSSCLLGGFSWILLIVIFGLTFKSLISTSILLYILNLIHPGRFFILNQLLIQLIQ